MEYVTDRDFPNQYADKVNVGLCDMRATPLVLQKGN